MGKALIVGISEVVNHLNKQTQLVFYPDENTDPADRFWACVEIGGGSVGIGALTTELAFGTLTTTAATGGVTELAATTGTVATALSADGDPTNEAQWLGKILETAWTVIGKYPIYLEKARQWGANALNIPTQQWNALGSRAAQWAANVRFLDEAIARGDSFRLATPFAQGWAETGTWYKAELIYLLQQGYELVIVNGQEWLIKPQ